MRVLLGIALLSGCGSDRTVQQCRSGEASCDGLVFVVCDHGVIESTEDCGAAGQVCVPDRGCAFCVPGSQACRDEVVVECGEDGLPFDGENCGVSGTECFEGRCLVCRPGETSCCTGWEPLDCQPRLDVLSCVEGGTWQMVERTCDASNNEVCIVEDGEATCRDACEAATVRRSNEGCEFYAVDLDNYAGSQGNAAAQQFGIVISNLGPLRAQVTVDLNDAPPGDVPAPQVIRSFAMEPGDLAVVDDLPPREVDGSAPGTFDTGTDTAYTSNAYRIASTVPIVVYQFNPLQNFDVFSNDASLLVPTTAVGSVGTAGSSYLVMGWPQLIADTDDPETDAGNDLRSFLTIVGTQADTHVVVETRSDVVGSPDVPMTPAGGTIEFDLGPFDVLNLESDGFGSDFSGSSVSSDKPVLVFSGSECGDVPTYATRFQRQCCCDHLEEQLVPTQTLGRTFVALQTPLRTLALANAGSDVTPLPREPEYWRFLAAENTTCTTTLSSPLDELSLQAGDPQTVESSGDFLVTCDAPVVVGQFVTGQWAVVGPNNNTEPAGDPDFILLPPVEQHRQDHLFVVPDTYAFDFLLIAARTDAAVLLDSVPIEEFSACERRPLGPTMLQGTPVDFDSIKCALSEPIVHSGVPPPNNVETGVQNDGVHRVQSDRPISVVVYGFDLGVSYGYAAGTELATINEE